MMSRARILNAVRNAAILILSLSAIYLMLSALNTSPAELYKSLMSSREDPAVPSGTESIGGVTFSTPHVILLTDEYGLHQAAKYDFQEKMKLFSQLSVTLGEALGSAHEPEIVSENDWQNALNSIGVFFDFFYPQPLNLIAAQLGTKMPEAVSEIMSKSLCITPYRDYIYLYYVNSITGEFSRLKTALSPDSLSARTPETELNAASFAFESDKALAAYDPYFVFSGEELIISAAQSVSPLLPFAEENVSLQAFSMNELASTSYSESDSARVYRESKKRLRVDTSGNVLFTATDGEGIPLSYSGDAPTLNDCIVSASALISSTIGKFSGVEEIGFLRVEEDSQGEGQTLLFGYYVNSIPVLVSNSEWCAKIKIVDASIVSAELIYRVFEINSEFLACLPEKQAAILSLRHDRSPLLFYVDSGSELTIEWFHNRFPLIQ